MLKIKDNIDLKELYKYDFINYGNEYIYDNDCEGYKIFTNCEERTIMIEARCGDFFNYKEMKDLDTLYDLIKAGLVEKVED